MPHDPALVADTRSWPTKSARDLSAATYELQAVPPFLDDIVFHSQQAVEKALKAFLTWHGRPFRKTHNLVELGEVCVQLDATLEDLLRRAAPLTEYAWKFRYPGFPDEPTQEEGKETLEIARQVHEALLDRLPADVRP
jgi:HEPN domain-containing protein